MQETTDKNQQKIILENGITVVHGKSQTPPNFASVTLSNTSSTETIQINEIEEFAFIRLPGIKIKPALLTKNQFANSAFLSKFNEFGIVMKILFINKAHFILEIKPLSTTGFERTGMKDCFPSHTTFYVEEILQNSIFWDLFWISNKGIPIVNDEKLIQIVLENLNLAL